VENLSGEAFRSLRNTGFTSAGAAYTSGNDIEKVLNRVLGWRKAVKASFSKKSRAEELCTVYGISLLIRATVIMHISSELIAFPVFIIGCIFIVLIIELAEKERKKNKNAAVKPLGEN
jgi:hypothetical protein